MINIPRSLMEKVKAVRSVFESLREDINSNTKENAKLLYRLEEAELQIKVLIEKVETLEKGS